MQPLLSRIEFQIDRWQDVNDGKLRWLLTPSS
jgi:hypothetical protein